MPDLGKHAVPVLGAYGLAFLLLAVLVVLTLRQARAAKLRLERAEAQVRQANADG